MYTYVHIHIYTYTLTHIYAYFMCMSVCATVYRATGYKHMLINTYELIGLDI